MFYWSRRLLWLTGKRMWELPAGGMPFRPHFSIGFIDSSASYYHIPLQLHRTVGRHRNGLRTIRLLTGSLIFKLPRLVPIEIKLPTTWIMAFALKLRRWQRRSGVKASRGRSSLQAVRIGLLLGLTMDKAETGGMRVPVGAGPGTSCWRACLGSL